jgi:copper chaperone
MTTTHAVLNVPAVACNHCKMAIEGALAQLPGIDHAEVDVAGKSLTVDYRADDVSLADIEAAVREEGYEVAGHHVFDV